MEMPTPQTDYDVHGSFVLFPGVCDMMPVVFVLPAGMCAVQGK